MSPQPEQLQRPVLQAARLRQVFEPAQGVRAFDLEPAAGAVRYPLGSHLEVEVQIAGKPALRCYSLVGQSAHAGAYRIAVREVADSRGGSRYLWSLQAGASLRISQPRSHFELGGDCPQYLLVAGGIGITPLLGMAQALSHRRAAFRLLYAGRAREQMAFLPELNALLGAQLSVFVSAEGTRLDLHRELRQLHPQGELYVCGPIGLLQAARAAFREAGRPASRLRMETFGSSGHRRAQAFAVAVTDHDQVVHVEREQSLLEALGAAGIAVPGHCRRGECGLCAVRVLEIDGELDHRDVFLDDEQRNQGRTLCPCVSRATGRLSIDTGYRTEL